MSPNAILEAIQRHRAFSQGKMEALRREMAATEKEAEELAVAEKVVRRLSAETGAQPEREPEPEEESEAAEPTEAAPPTQNGEPGFSYGH